MKRIGRSLFIFYIALRYGLDNLVLTSLGKPWLTTLANALAFGRATAPRGLAV